MTMKYRRALIDDAEAVARVHCESWRTTYPGLIPDHIIEVWSDLEKRTQGWREIIATRAETLWLADQDDDVVGFADGGVAREPNDGFSGQLFGIYLLKSAQRRGVGRALVGHVFDDLRAKGYSSARVEVLATNSPAIRFYQGLGARYVRDVPVEMMGETLIESVYGWNRLPETTQLTSQVAN